MKKADGKRCTKQIFLKRSHSYNSILEPVSIVKTSIFSPPLYGHPPGPLASLSFTSLFRTSPLQLSTTPESSDNESFNRTQNINFVKRYPLTAKVPTYEYYGFVLYLGSSIVFGVYIIWSYFPVSWLDAIGITYYPERWWSLTLPSYLIITIIYIYFALIGYNTKVLTPKLNQMECITDLYAKVSSSVNIKPTSDAVIDLPIGEVSFLLYGDSDFTYQDFIELLINYIIKIMFIALISSFEISLSQSSIDNKSIYEDIENFRIKSLKPKIPKKSKQSINNFYQIDKLETAPNQLYCSKNKNKSIIDFPNDLNNIYYYTKIINWYDIIIGCIVQRTIVCQNENDLCPIIALTNLLILQNSERDFLSSYFSLNNSRISSNLLLSIIADYAVSNIPEECLDDVFSYLLHLHKELNVNPCFKDSLQFDSQESKLFSALGVQLLHGWLPSIKQDGQDIYNVVIKAGTYKNALEKITVMKELLKNKKSESNFNDKNIFEGQLLNHFFSSYPHCLTPYGLTVLRTNLSPGKLSILFHNFRFSLLYSHYQTGDLYTLVTDCDYKDYENKVVWKSLETSLYFNAEFTLQNILPNDLSDIDNDFAFALNLQLIEDQQKENWIYHLSQSQKYKKRKTPKKYKQKNNNLNNVIIPSWKKRNSSNDSEELNRHLRKEKKCIIF
ncbi:hypothetical protein PCK1_001266 [Pneumocystis canis]|nr:hypothetical protein PCK1_001266 [Pneumocystis canis]